MEKLKEIIEIFSEDYRSSKRIKLASWLSIFLLCFILTLLLETLLFGSGRFYGRDLSVDDIEETYEGFRENPDGSYTPLDQEAIIRFNYPEGYIYKLRFYAMADSDIPVEYELACLNDYPPPFVDFYNSFLNSEETYVIDAVSDEFIVYIFNAKDVPIRFNLLELDYEIVNNPVRMSATFIILLVLSYLLLCMIGAIRLKLDRIAFVLVLSFGLLLSFLVPARYSYDEYVHLIRALNVSNGNLISEEGDYSNYPYGFETLSRLDYRSYDDFIKAYQDYEEIKDEDSEDLQLVGSADSYFFIPYIFSAFGIKLSRVLGLSLYYLSAFSKLFNIFVYAVAVYLAVKLFSSNRLLIFFVALSPIMLSMAASAGLGSVQNSCFLVGLAYLGYLVVDKKKITVKDYVIVVSIFSIVTVCRVTYGFLMLLLLLLPKEKFTNQNLRRFNKLYTVLITFIVMLAVYMYSTRIGLTILEVPGADFDDQLEEILKNPFRFIFILWKYTTTVLLNQGNLQDFGYIVYMGRITGLYTFLSSILLIVLTFSGNPNKVLFDDYKSRILAWSLFIIAIAASEAALYLTFTEVGARSVTGFQTRYLMSILLVPLLTLEGRSLYLKYNRKVMEKVTIFSSWFLLFQMIGSLVVKYYR